MHLCCGKIGTNAPAEKMLSWVHTHEILCLEANLMGAQMICNLGYRQSLYQSMFYRDSGGPLVLIGGGVPTQIGVALFGADMDTDDCSACYPNCYKRTTSFLAWIQKKTDVKIRD